MSFSTEQVLYFGRSTVHNHSKSAFLVHFLISHCTGSNSKRAASLEFRRLWRHFALHWASDPHNICKGYVKSALLCLHIH
uniref:Uncharacterized protein n=1 Tax=Pyxicephalus adspersus TaxID=30357 RepID=A0AAV3AC37_PYXAD|nr:TPA: hypothetical protein GDO54_011842 [Pyxicephalus adspersus]